MENVMHASLKCLVLKVVTGKYFYQKIINKIYQHNDFGKCNLP